MACEAGTEIEPGEEKQDMAYGLGMHREEKGEGSNGRWRVIHDGGDGGKFRGCGAPWVINYLYGATGQCSGTAHQSACHDNKN